MSTNSELLADLPLYAGLTPAQLAPIVDRFEEVRLEPDHVLFERGSAADRLHLLLEGHVDLLEGGSVKVSLKAVCPIGELGAMTPGLIRNTTAVVVAPSRLLRASREELLAAIAAHPEVGLRIHQNLLDIVSNKIARDGRRIHQMRHNLIRTQKAMKMLRDELLSQPTTPISDAFHDTLEALISHNRRANYSVVPPTALPASVRVGGDEHPVLRIARNRLRVADGGANGGSDQWAGVLVLAKTELPISGTIIDRSEGALEVELDLLIDEYSDALEDYLTRAQMLDLIV